MDKQTLISKPITIIILNYNGADDTIECVHSLQRNLHNIDLLEIVVLDNASTDDSYIKISSTIGNAVTLIKNEGNAGYAAGNNIGIQYALTRGDGYICILNNDTIAVSDFLTPCIKALQDNPKAIITTPAIIDYKTGNYQNTGGKVSLIRAKTVFYNVEVSHDSNLPKQIECDTVQGSVMVFRSSTIDMLGLIPEYYFMYFEETEWCYRAKLKGYHCLSLTDVSILHKGWASMDGRSQVAQYIYERNRVVFAKQFLNPYMFLLFLAIDFFRSIFRSLLNKEPIWKYVKWHWDGVKNHINKELFSIPGAVWKNEF